MRSPFELTGIKGGILFTGDFVLVFYDNRCPRVIVRTKMITIIINLHVLENYSNDYDQLQKIKNPMDSYQLDLLHNLTVEVHRYLHYSCKYKF